LKNLSNENIIHDDVLRFRKLLEYNLEHYITCKNSKVEIPESIHPKQSHTKNVEIYKEGMNLEDIDGLITDEQGIAITLRYADCIPLLFYDPVKNVVANIHSGWKGTLQKIGQIATKKMINEMGCDPKDIICAIGPSIRKCHFEVQEDVNSLFREEFSYAINGKYIDTVLINKVLLKEIGLKTENIIDSEICTVCNKDLLYSYRGNNDKGRMTALICMKN